MSGISGGGDAISSAEGGYGSCIRFTTQLVKPQPRVAAQLTVGAVMQVSVVRSGSSLLVQLTYRGQPAGGLLGSMTLRLRESLLNGRAFQATVAAINGGLVTLRVEPV